MMRKSPWKWNIWQRLCTWESGWCLCCLLGWFGEPVGSRSNLGETASKERTPGMLHLRLSRTPGGGSSW